MHVRVDVAGPPAGGVTLVGANEQLRPLLETEADKATALLKLLILLTVMVEVPEEPVLIVREVGFAERV